MNDKLKDSSLSRSQVSTLHAVKDWLGWCGERPLELPKEKPSIPPQALCFFRDGNQICCVFGDFINLQESPAGFGADYDAAVDDLQRQHNKMKGKDQ